MGTIRLIEEKRFGRLRILLNDRLLGCYNYHPYLSKPYFYPLIGAGGKNIVEDQPADHLHHRGVWYAHHEVNGHDFYLERGGQGIICHEGFSHYWEEERAAGIAASNSWLTPDGQTVLHDQRTFVIHDVGDGAWALDLVFVLVASQGPVTFTDTKEAGFPLVRVADHLDELDGGRITNAQGEVGEQATFGKRTPWVDYSGPVGGHSRVPRGTWHGLALFDHPRNPGHPPAAFTRSYGPFSLREGFHFEGERTLAAGERYVLAHRLYFHHGDVQEGRVAEAFATYAESKPWVPE